jgi:L-ascorbate metabolism protein UlaG (beta-lactamase superfamily)
MTLPTLKITYVGGPTCLLEFGGVQFLTDPTFDPAGGEYSTGAVTLRKLAGPSLSAEDLGSFDYVLLSHDHHSDNLDLAGRQLLAKARNVLTTTDGAQRLGGNSIGLKDWQSFDCVVPDGRTLRVVATPGRHGAEGLSRGAVNGFALFSTDTPDYVVYLSGDTVWYPGVAEVANRYDVRVALLHLGAARVPEVGPFHLTMTAEEAVQAAHSLSNAVIVPIHFEDWAHFSEGGSDIERTFANARMENRIRWPYRGHTIAIDCSPQAPNQRTSA